MVFLGNFKDVFDAAEITSHFVTEFFQVGVRQDVELKLWAGLVLVQNTFDMVSLRNWIRLHFNGHFPGEPVLILSCEISSSTFFWMRLLFWVFG